MLKNLNILYDNLLKKSKETEQKLEKYERIKDKSALITNSMEISNTQNEQTQINKNINDISGNQFKRNQ